MECDREFPDRRRRSYPQDSSRPRDRGKRPRQTPAPRMSLAHRRQKREPPRAPTETPETPDASVDSAQSISRYRSMLHKQSATHIETKPAASTRFPSSEPANDAPPVSRRSPTYT